jgi:hypothetical protein
MPKPSNRQTPQGRKSKAAAACNNRAVTKVLKGEEGAFARVEKALGFSQFLVRYNDGHQTYEDVIATPRGTFSAGGKVRVRICVGDIVLLDGVQELPDARKKGKKMIVEITGKLEKKEARQLYSDGRIDKSVFQDGACAVEDDIFEAGDDEEAEAGADDDEEVDVDAI